MSVFVADSADVASDADIGAGTRVWDLAHVREGVRIGRGCIVGRGAYIDHDVVIGDHCKIQNYALIYAPAHLADGVFVGPAAVLTNDVFPRAIRPDGALVEMGDWEPAGVSVGRGASIGAGAVIVAGVEIGPYALVGAGSVVTRDVGAYSLVHGNPARHRGWVGRSGQVLREEGNALLDPETGDRFREVEGTLEDA